MFSFWKKSIGGHALATNNVAQTHAYSGNSVINARFGSAFNKNLVRVINNNIALNTSNLTRGEISRPMQQDLPRMAYYIDGNDISVPGSVEKSVANFHDITHRDASLSWLPQYIDSISAFLHQGIFVDIFESVPTWQDEQGRNWDIQMISLDSKKTNNSFHINRHGEIKVIVQSGVSNLLLPNGEIIFTDSEKSHLQMQLTLLIERNADGSCMVSNACNKADHAVLTVSCQGAR